MVCSFAKTQNGATPEEYARFFRTGAQMFLGLQ
jgi:hypothetical protein